MPDETPHVPSSPPLIRVVFVSPLSQQEQRQLVLDIEALLLADNGEACWQAGYATSTRTMGIVEGGKN